MTAEEIEAILAERYKGPGWALFFQYMPMTSFEATMNRIDLIAVGLWHKHDKIMAFEIKVGRSDFLKDLKQFKKKHQFALRISDEFFYVCPWGLIEKEEVPVDAGLMYVNKGNKIKIMKPARVRIVKQVPFQLFQGFAREFGNKVDHTKIPVKYLGKNMTQDDILALVEEKRDWDFSNQVKAKALEIVKKKEAKAGARDEFMRAILEYSWRIEEKEKYPELLKFCNVGKQVDEDSNFMDHLKHLKEELGKIIESIKEKGRKK